MRDLFAAMKSAQAGAITRAVEHRFYFAPEDNEYWIAREVVPEAGEPTFEALEGRAGEVVRLPQGLEMQKPSARRGRESGTYYVSFYPNGACDIATVNVALADDPRAEYAIETTGIMVLFGAPES